MRRREERGVVGLVRHGERKETEIGQVHLRWKKEGEKGVGENSGECFEG